MENENIMLTKTVAEDLETLFLFQTDEEAIYFAAFTPENPGDKEAYFKKYSEIIINPTINMKTIKIGDEIVGSVARFVRDNENEITYWIDKKHWGKGIGTAALEKFLTIEMVRPIIAQVAFDNARSQKVLENCGFVKTGSKRGFANARQSEIEEYVYTLSS